MSAFGVHRKGIRLRVLSLRDHRWLAATSEDGMVPFLGYAGTYYFKNINAENKKQCIYCNPHRHMLLSVTVNMCVMLHLVFTKRVSYK